MKSTTELPEESKTSVNSQDADISNVSGSYTEEDVRMAIEMAREPEYWDSGHYWGQLYSEQEIIDELTNN